MTRQIYLDTGVVMLNFIQNPPVNIQKLYERLKNEIHSAYILRPVIEELAYHICVAYGKAKVDSYIQSFIQNYKINIIQPDLNLISQSGVLKCKYRTFLSYYDALIITYCLQTKKELHTTEKRMRKKFRPEIINQLKIIPYRFD
jgi:predicted nucleic acid-binding protein